MNSRMNGTMKKLLCAGAIALSALAPLAQAEEKKTFDLAWTIYVGWMPWKYADESGIMKKWADKYGIEVNITQINDYVESINQYTAGQFDGVVATSMDALSIPAAGGVDSTALIVGSYSNGNDGVVMKGSDDLRQIKGQDVHLVELSVSHYLLAKALDSVGLSERDVKVVNTSDADLVSAFSSRDVRNVVTWSPLLQEVADMADAKVVFDSTQVPGHIKDLLIVNSETLTDNPAFGKAVTGAWYEVMAILASDTAQGAALRAELGAASGTDQAGYEAQLATTHMFYDPAQAVGFVSGALARDALDSVRRFSFDHGLMGDSADSVEFVGISLPGGKLLGREDNVKLRFDTSFMQQAADSKL